MADNLVTKREQEFEKSSVKKESFGQRVENFLHRVTRTPYELELEAEERRQEEQRWKEEAMSEE